MSEPVVRLLSRVTPPWCQECRALCFLRCSRLHARHTHGEAGHGPAVVTAPRRLPKKRKLRPNQRTQTRLLPQPHPSPARGPAPAPVPSGFGGLVDWWEAAAVVLGVTNLTVTDSDVRRQVKRAPTPVAVPEPAESAEPPPPLPLPVLPPVRTTMRLRQWEDPIFEADDYGGVPVAAEASPGSPEEPLSAPASHGSFFYRSRSPSLVAGQSASPDRRQSPNRSFFSSRRNSLDDREATDDRDGIPGLDFLYRLYAPKALLEEYERLEKVVESRAFRRMSPEEKAGVRAKLEETQAAIEARDNRLNVFAAGLGGLHGLYVGTMASMLTVFVPQRCGPTARVPVSHTCTLYDNTHNLSLFNQGVLAVNAFTLTLMMVTELTVFRREQWLDRTLSYNARRASNNLSYSVDEKPSILQQHPYIAHTMLYQNLAAGNLARITIIMVVINLILSSVLILGFYSDGLRSVNALISNTLLLGAKLLVSAIVCLRAKNTQEGVSLYKMQRITFNVLDMNYLKSDEYKRHQEDYTWEDVKEEAQAVRAAEQGDLKTMVRHGRKVLRLMTHGSVSRTDSRRSFRARLASAKSEGGDSFSGDRPPRASRVGRISASFPTMRIMPPALHSTHHVREATSSDEEAPRGRV